MRVNHGKLNFLAKYEECSSSGRASRERRGAIKKRTKDLQHDQKVWLKKTLPFSNFYQRRIFGICEDSSKSKRRVVDLPEGRIRAYRAQFYAMGGLDTIWEVCEPLPKNKELNPRESKHKGGEMQKIRESEIANSKGGTSITRWT